MSVLKPTDAPPAPFKRDMSLDVLRGIAILMVLGCHFVVYPCDAGKLKYLSIGMERIGWTGVDLFFVLSGFLIGGLLFKELKRSGGLNVQRFLVRRALKIWPAYFMLLAFVFLHLVRHGETVGSAFHALVPNLLHVQNYFGSPRSQTWSLAVEEHFYLVLPVILWILARRPERGLSAIPWIALGLAVICLALRISTFAGKGFNGAALANTQFRIDSLFAGVFVAYLFHFEPEFLQAVANKRWLLMIVAAALLMPILWLGMDRTSVSITVGFTMVYIAYACILIVVIHTQPGCGLLGRALKSWPAKILASIGLYSYSIYLWHRDLGQYPVEVRLRPLFAHWPAELSWTALTLAYFTLAVLGGVIMTFLVEKPSLALRERLFPAVAIAKTARLPALERVHA